MNINESFNHGCRSRQESSCAQAGLIGYPVRAGDKVQKPLRTVLLLSTTLAAVGCGASLEALNRLAASGSIHEDAPVTTHVQVQIGAPVAQVWALLIDARSWHPALGFAPPSRLKFNPEPAEL
jgi:hypothetical protein